MQGLDAFDYLMNNALCSDNMNMKWYMRLIQIKDELIKDQYEIEHTLSENETYQHAVENIEQKAKELGKPVLDILITVKYTLDKLEEKEQLPFIEGYFGKKNAEVILNIISKFICVPF